MNDYFKPRTPEPSPSAAGIVIGSMICVIVLVLVGAGIWMGQDAIRRGAGSEELVEEGRAGPETNQDVVQVPGPGMTVSWSR